MTGIGFGTTRLCMALHWGNPLALFNAFAAFDNVHGYYLTPDGTNNDEIAYGYTETELEAILATGLPGSALPSRRRGQQVLHDPGEEPADDEPDHGVGAGSVETVGATDHRPDLTGGEGADRPGV